MAHGHAVDHDDWKYPLLDFSAGSIKCLVTKPSIAGRLRTEMEELEDFTLLYCFVSRTVFFKSRYKLRRIRSIGNIHIHSNQSGHMDLHCFYAAQLPVGLYRLFW